MKVIDQSIGDNYALYHGDSCEVLKAIPDNSIHYTITSPPFSSLYTYSASDRDMGNCSGDDEFFAHFQFLIKELYRITRPGRLLSLHCMNLPSTLTHQGYIGVRDFRGDLIRAFSGNQWIYHSEVCIWKDPVIAMQRTKAIGLLHKQVCKDSSISRQGIPDYLVTMRKPGNNEEPVSGKLEYFAGENPPNRSGDSTRDSINIWQRYASPVWMDINPSRTLQYTTAKDKNDERHISPLQLDVIERGIQLWTNPGETVLDPFNGIGSTGHVALSRNRKYIGVELKDTYYAIAKQNLYDVSSVAQQSLF
jgi:DNA modification methylase